MAEEIKDLIEKIQQEGFFAAENKAKEIEDKAIRKAEGIIKEAKRAAEEIIAQAKDTVEQLEESSNASLKQACRDLLIGLRKEINVMLDHLVVSRVREFLAPEETGKIIFSLIKDYASQEKGGIIVSLKKEDLEKIEKIFLYELKEAAKKGVILKSSEEIHGGFIISYDAGKSYYDFSDDAIASYIGSFLKPKLRGLLADSAK